MTRGLRPLGLFVLAAALATTSVSCSSSLGKNSNISEQQAYTQEGAYISAALKAAGLTATSVYDLPDPTVEYHSGSAGNIDKNWVDMSRSLSLHNLTTAEMLRIVSAVDHFWTSLGYGQMAISSNGLSISAVPPGNVYQLSASEEASNFTFSVAGPTIPDDHMYSVAAT